MPDSFAKNIVYLSKAQYQELVTNQSITVDGVTYTYNENDIYVTPQEEPVSDVQVAGTSVVSNGVANVPAAEESGGFGLVKLGSSYGIKRNTTNDLLCISAGTTSEIKTGVNVWKPIIPYRQHEAVFYGRAKAAGADMKDIANTTVGTYPETQKSAISQMLSAPETVSGSTPSITAKAGIRYVCGECSTLDITLPASGIVDVVFESGSTATVLTVTPPTGVTAVLWPDGFDPTSLDADTIYEINILDGKLAEVGKWATT